MACAYDQFDRCSERPSGSADDQKSTVQTVSLQASVGRGGRNLWNDVASVQEALNRIDQAMGGPIPPLAVDGFVGPKTVGAIDRFQKVQFPQNFPDGRMDPGQKTVTRLNALLNGQYAAAGTITNIFGFGEGAGNGTKQVSDLIPIPTTVPFQEPKTDDQRLALAEKLALDAERRLTAATNKLGLAIKAMAKTNRTAAEQQLVREIDWHFKASADADPAGHMLKVSVVLATMLMAIRGQNLGTRSIFRAGTEPDPKTIAAAEYGGYTSTKKEDRYIIITPQFRTQSSGVIVHELAHFCGGKRGSTTAIMHRASPKPPPTGEQREHGTKNYKEMSSADARTNVFSYMIYCFPEWPEFKVP